MVDTQSKELKVRDKQEVASPAEQTVPGLVFTPAVDIFETEKEITLLAKSRLPISSYIVHFSASIRLLVV